MTPSLKLLSDFQKELDQLKYPNTPPHHIVQKKFTDKNEKGLMECVEVYCEFTKCGFFWRTPNKSSQVGSSAKLRTKAKIDEVLSGMATESIKPVFGYSSGTNGMSDMSGFFTVKKIPISVALEIKIPGDTQKPDQVKFEAKVKRGGGIYAIITNFEDFLALKNKIVDRINCILQPPPSTP